MTVGDYTVAVSGLGVHNSSRKTSHRTHRPCAAGVAAWVCVKNIGTLLMTEHKLADAKAEKLPGDAFREATASGEETRDVRWGVQLDLLRRQQQRQAAGQIGGAGRARAKVSELAKQKVTNVGEAFVTFNYEMHASNCSTIIAAASSSRILGWFEMRPRRA